MIPFLIAAVTFIVVFCCYSSLQLALWSAVGIGTAALILGCIINYFIDNPRPTNHEMDPRIVGEQVDRALRTTHYKHGNWTILYEKHEPRQNEPLVIHAEYHIKDSDPNVIQEPATLYLDASISRSASGKSVLQLEWKPEAGLTRWHHTILIFRTTQKINKLLNGQLFLNPPE